jgi:hypothetical protein
MSEKQTRSPEASPETIAELYQAAADYLETAIQLGTAVKEPALYEHVSMLTVTAEVPELNGRRIVLKYDRPATDDDLTQVDLDIPLAWVDETGRNHWQTPIDIEVHDANGPQLHDYSVEYVKYTDRPDFTRSIDNAMQPSGDPDDYGTLSQIDAKEIIGHLEWALESQNQQP